MRHRLWPSVLGLLTLAACAIFAPAANAGTYWWSGAATAGSNGFSFPTTAGYNAWANHCETIAGSYVTDQRCILSWNTPANLDAVAGSWTGDYRHANPNFEMQIPVDGNGTTTYQGTSTRATFNRTWADMGAYAQIHLRAEANVSVSAASQDFNAGTFTIQLVDPYNPGVSFTSGHTGWKGPGGACVRYAASDAGSGVSATSLTNVTTGAVYENPGFDPGTVTTGVFNVDRNCVNVPAPGTGNYTIRAAVADKSGNGASVDTVMSFDTTAPAVGIPQFAAADVTNGQEFRGSNGQYRPSFSFTASDAHSGLASTQILLDGVVQSNTTSWTPGADLALGSHTLTVRATDAVGNQSSVVRTINVIDDVAPTFTVASPGATGDNEPVLDITAADDHSGVAPATYTVTVNGASLVATTATNRLQANIGALVNGTHTIVVTVKDAQNNTGQETITYEANSGDGTPAVPPDKLTGTYLFASPSGSINHGSDVRIAAVMAENGRPVPGRAEVHKDATTLAGKDLSQWGVVDMQVTITTEGPITLHPPSGSGLATETINYTYVPPNDNDLTGGTACDTNPSLPQCQTGGGGGGTGGDGGTGGTGGDGGSTTVIYCGTPNAPSNCKTPVPGTCSGPWSCNTVELCRGTTNLRCYNGLPVGDSGVKGVDRVAPRFNMKPIRMKKAWVLKRKQLRVRLWTSELSVVRTQTAGDRLRATASARRKWRVIGLRVNPRSAVYRQIKKAKPGSLVKVRVRVLVQDKAGNRTKNRWYTMKFRV